MRVLSTAVGLALAFIMIGPTPSNAAKQAILIRDDTDEFCMSLTDEAEWFIDDFSGHAYYSNQMEHHSNKDGKGHFGDKKEIVASDGSTVHGSVSGKFKIGGEGRASFKDRSTGRKIRLTNDQVEVIPAGCFDPGHF